MEETEVVTASQSGDVASESKSNTASEPQTNSSPEHTFDMKECKEALKECTSAHDDDEDSSEEEFSDANGVPNNVEYDEAHLKQLYDELPEKQLEEFKEQAIGLKNEGNEEYRNKNFKEAIALYTQALNSCPLQFFTERSILYANRAAAYVGLEKNEEAVADCDKALNLNPDYLKARLRRAQLHRNMDHLDQSLEDYKKILEMDHDNRDARQACATLPDEINARNERLKTEMLGKLKDLGNLVLRPFGLSTDNFNLVQDPNSGGYSVNFQNNSK